MDTPEEPIVYIGAETRYSSTDVTVFQCSQIQGTNRSGAQLAPGLDLFLTSIVLRRPDIRKIHVFCGECALGCSPRKSLHVAVNAMKYSGVVLQSHSGGFEQAEMLAQQQRQAKATIVKEAILVEESKPT